MRVNPTAMVCFSINFGVSFFRDDQRDQTMCYLGYGVHFRNDIADIEVLIDLVRKSLLMGENTLFHFDI